MKLRTKLVPLALVGVIALSGCADGTDDPVTDGVDVPETTLVPGDGSTETTTGLTETTMIDDTSSTTGG